MAVPIPTFTDADGTEHQVAEPRVLRMIRALIGRQGKVARMKSGEVALHFGSPHQPLKVKWTESEHG